MSVYSNVVDILRRYPAARDQDLELFKQYWSRYDGLDLEMPISTMGHSVALTNPRTIERQRRRVQAAYPELGPVDREVRGHRDRQQ